MLKEEIGWVGVFTREQHGALRNDTRVKKDRGDPGDLTPIGTEGTVLGSVYHPGIGTIYFIEWDNRPRHAVGVVAWKLSLLLEEK